MDDVVNLFAGGLSLASLWFLRNLSRQHLVTRFALRLAESDQAFRLFSGMPLRKQADNSTSLLDAVPLAMFAVSLDGNVSAWNRAAEKTLGWSRDEVLGHKLPSLVLDPVQPVPEDPQPSGSRICLLRKDGARLPSEVRSVPIRDANGSVNGILTIVQG